jgi:hypothetical protein
MGLMRYCFILIHSANCLHCITWGQWSVCHRIGGRPCLTPTPNSYRPDSRSRLYARLTNSSNRLRSGIERSSSLLLSPNLSARLHRKNNASPLPPEKVYESLKCWLAVSPDGAIMNTLAFSVTVIGVHITGIANVHVDRLVHHLAPFGTIFFARRLVSRCLALRVSEPVNNPHI